jgi:hypothetical protein
MDQWIGNLSVGYLLFLIVVGHIIGAAIIAVIKNVMYGFDGALSRSEELRDSYRQ